MNEPQASAQPLPEEPQTDPPRPSFDLLPLSDEVKRALVEMAYVNPTPVQLAVWDPATRGKDAVVQARTGTGKTASFGLPIIDHIIKRSTEGVQALVLTPTRELAVQVTNEIERLGKYKGTKTVAIYGGASMDRQVSLLAQGAQLVVGTPGRVLDHIRRGTLKTGNIRLLVLDEADEMLSMGFERELTSILESLPASRQTLLFSATVPPDIERISKSKLKEPEFVTLSGDHIGALEIQHYTYLVPGDKIGALVQIIEAENPESAIVFCNTRDQTESVAAALSSRGFDADWLNGDLPQSERESVMARTKQGQLRFLVATDVAARGIDVSHLTHVINFDFPQDAETYVHRTGRTGRAGRTGTAISLVLPQDIGGLYLLRLTYKIRPIERVVPSASELKTRAEADLVAILAEALLPKGHNEDDRGLARRLLTHDHIEGILAGLLREYLGARPTAEADAAAARRKTVRRATIKQRRSDPPARAREAAQPASAVEDAPSAAPAADALPAVRTSPLAHEEPATGEQPSSGANAARQEDRPPRPDFGRDRGRFRDDRDRPGRDRPRGEFRGEPRGERAEARPPQDNAGAPQPTEARREGPPRQDDRGRDRDRDRGRRPERRAGGAPDFVGWTPPAEAGDDEPLLPKPQTPPQRREEHRREEQRREEHRVPPAANHRERPEPRADAPARALSLDAPVSAPELPVLGDEVPYVELFIGVGRRDGARAQDLLRALVEAAGVDKDHIRRIRVRDRHAFVAIRKDQAERAISRLNGTTLGDKLGAKGPVLVELARERTGVDDASVEAPLD